MGNLIEDLSAPAPAIPNNRCSVAIAREKLSDEERAIVDERLADEEWTAPALADVFKRHDLAIPLSAVKRHRKQRCSC